MISKIWIGFCLTVALASCGSKKSSDDTTTAADSTQFTALKTIMASKCATSGCHVAGAPGGDWVSSEASFKAKLTTIQSYVAAETMPKSGSTKLTTDEKNKFALYPN